MKTSSIIFLPCTNIKNTLSFYHDLLHLPIYQTQGDHLYIFDTGYGYWGFCEYSDQRVPLSGPKGVCLSINLDSKEEVLQKYEELKDVVKVYQEPKQHPTFPVYSFFILDPDGYLVEFQKINP